MDQSVRKKPRKTTKVCAVASCTSPKEASFHRFPKNEKLSKIWLNACKRKDAVNVRTAYVCSEHFPEEDFERDLMNELLNQPTRRKLKPCKSLDLKHVQF